MSDPAETASEAVERLSRRDPTLKRIDLIRKRLTDAELAELADCLLAHPDVVTYVRLRNNQLTDETGVKLARYIAASSTIEWLDLSNNQLGSATYLALAAALRVNSSLRELYLSNNQAVDRTRIDAAFVEALRLNPNRSADSVWWLYSFGQKDSQRLRALARAAGPMSPAAASPAPWLLTGAASAVGGDERVRQLEQQLRERDEAAAGMQAQIRDVQASLEATQAQLAERTAQLSASQTQLSAAQAQLAERTSQLAAERQDRTAQVQRLEHELNTERLSKAAVQAERDRLLGASSRAASSSSLLDQWTYPLSSVHINEEAVVTLGEGAVGSVVRAQWQHTTVALKRLHFMDDSAAAVAAMGGSLSAEDRRAVLGQFMNECQTNARLRHPHIVAFLGLVADGGAPRYLMLEHMAGGTLHDLVHSPGELSAQRLDGILLGVCKALHYLHSLRPAVLHLDVKPKNVLLDGSVAKLGDLGEAHIIRSTATRTARSGTMSPYGVGTLDYMAPEMHVASAIKTGKADMFSFGVMAAECAARKLPEPLDAMLYVDDRRVVLIEEERRMADIAAVGAEHMRELVTHTIVERVDRRWSALQALEFLSRIQ